MKYTKWVLLLLAFCVVCVGTYLYIRTQRAEMPLPSGWEVYTSNAFDFEIQHPDFLQFERYIADKNGIGIESADGRTDKTFYHLSIFARGQDFVVEGCLELYGSAQDQATSTKSVRGGTFYVIEERVQPTDMKGYIVPNALRSEYHAIYNNQCYIARLSVSARNDKYGEIDQMDQMREDIVLLEQVFSTFKFTQ